MSCKALTCDCSIGITPPYAPRTRQPTLGRAVIARLGDRRAAAIVIEAYSAYPAKHSFSDLRRAVARPRLSGSKGGIGVSEEELKKRLEMLRIEHRDLDAAIDALTSAGGTDQLQIARLKKRKLRLKDQIALLEDYLIPDIIA